MAKVDIKNITQKFPQLLDRDKSKVSMHPHVVWGVFLAVSFALFILLIAANSYLFIQINEELIFSKERAVDEEIEMMNVDVLKTTIEFFDGRAETFENLIEQKSYIVDPSL